MVRAVVLAAVLSLAAAAHARSTGQTGNSGKGPSTCASCHNAGEPRPTITVEGLEGPLAAGDSVLFTIVVHRESDTGGVDDCPDRCAGFGAATTGAGTFRVVPGTATRRNVSGTEVTHTQPQPFDDDGNARFQIELEELCGGEHTLFVGANDVNGNDASSGDRNATIEVDFTVDGDACKDPSGEGEGEGETGEGEGEGEPRTLCADAEADADPAPASGLLAVAFVTLRATRRSARRSRA